MGNMRRAIRGSGRQFRSIRRASGPLRAEMTRACSGIVASCSKSVLQASRADHGPQDLGVADVAVGAAECGLVGVDDGVGVQRVELAGREVVCMARRGQRDGGRWGLLLVAVVSHGSPAVGGVVGGLVILASKEACSWVPPPDGPIGGGESRQ